METEEFADMLENKSAIELMRSLASN